MRLLGDMTSEGATQRAETGEGWSRGYGATVSSPPKTAARIAAELELKVKRLEKANTELAAALTKLIIFAAPRTAIVNECGDKIVDPNVLNAKAVLTAVEAGL
jgi:hypothetical protein